MKHLFFIISIFLTIVSCSKKEVSSNDKIVTTWAHNFQPAILYCNLGDTIFFDLGGSHNAIEVSQSTYNANESTPIGNGFEFGYGENGFFVPDEKKTYYYVCEPHLPQMKARIIVQ